MDNKLRSLPAIDRLVSAAAADPEIGDYPRELVTSCLRQAVAAAREALRQGQDIGTSPEMLVEAAKAQLKKLSQPSLRRVINATGVVLHTNLGRAPLSGRAQACVNSTMGSYSNLEYDCTTGERGSRYSHVVEQLCRLTGAEDAIVVNNNAAAVLLVLSAIAKDREVIVSRGELVEIGGSFRIPDVLRQSGAALVEVGTTNKTHLADYEQAISPNTAAILKVHTSNYCIVGFTSQPAAEDLTALARRHGLPIIEDLGSGTLLPLTVGGQTEPGVTERLRQGFDMVTFSGDKLLGAGQAGIIAGKKQYISMMKKHPLLRAIRIDKLSLAALEGTLMEYTIGYPTANIPVLAMLAASLDELEKRAERLKAAIIQSGVGILTEVIPLKSFAGGGSLPAAMLEGYGVAVSSPAMSASMLESRLRQNPTPIVVRVHEDKVLLDVRCITEQDIAEIAAVLGKIVINRP